MFDEVMTTDRLLFRPPLVDDAAPIFDRWTSDPEVCRFLMWEAHHSVEETREFLAGCQQAWEQPEDRFPWVLAELDDPDHSPIGMLEINVDGHIAAAGYVLAPDHQRRGYATEALTHIIDTALNTSSIQRVAATTDVENTASVRVMEKSGMQREGRLRRFCLRPQLGDQARDAYIYAATI